MDITTMLNSKDPATAAAAEQQLQQLARATQGNPRTILQNGTIISHQSREPSLYPLRSSKPLQPISNGSNGVDYHSSGELSQPTLAPLDHYTSQGMNYQNGYTHSENQSGQHFSPRESSSTPRQPMGQEDMKAFGCNNCGKRFARRSDLARHERIHTGHRPHVCDFPGCEKRFIQRSALTVHSRVHSGDKPHMCERCGKPFSDSSSLARHRRIHSGKRPYKCPYADCQKTFTRRTTLTRHQNHHTGTVEEAARATAAALANHTPETRQRMESDGATYSEPGSAISTPSSLQETMSLSPNTDIPVIPPLSRMASDFSHTSNSSLPPHLRTDIPQSSARSSPSMVSPSSTTFPARPHHRPSLTSVPSGYGPPPVLEPPTHHDRRQSGGSASGSPHLGAIGWQPPAHQALHSPSHMSPSHAEHFIYPEPPYNPNPAPHLYYPSSNIRRPRSSERDQYDPKPRLVNGEADGMWAGN